MDPSNGRTNTFFSLSMVPLDPSLTSHGCTSADKKTEGWGEGMGRGDERGNRKSHGGVRKTRHKKRSPEHAKWASRQGFTRSPAAKHRSEQLDKRKNRPPNCALGCKSKYIPCLLCFCFFVARWCLTHHWFFFVAQEMRRRRVKK